MHLVNDLVQPIVDKTIAIVKKNVNIMDENAIIIASGDSTLIGVFHEGAHLVITQKKSIMVYPDEVKQLKGVIRPGVNVPIVIGGKMIGVVGISGHPDEVASSAELVKVMLESLLEQIILKEQLDLETRAGENFLNDLLTDKAIIDENSFINRARILGYDITIPRYAIVINVNNFREIVRKKTAHHKNILGEIALQQLKEKVMASLKKIDVPGGNSIIIFVGGDEFVCLHSGEAPFEKGKMRRDINHSLAMIKDTIKADTGLETTIGVGMRYESFKDYYRSFQEGRNAIKIGKCLKGAGHTFWIDKLRLENLIASIPESVLKNYVDNTLGKVILKSPLNAREDAFKTLDALFHNALNPTKTAREMFVHRNTILFRLDKLYKETGYKPSEFFNDASELYIALLGYKFLKLGILGKNSFNNED